jgi:putative pyoverdin transport system ATP-binding/permease protein
MKKLKTILQITGKSYRDLVKFSLIGLIAGSCGLTFITLLNKSIQLLIEDKLHLQRTELVLLFFAVIIVFFSARRLLAVGIIGFSQSLFWNMRKEIIKIILGSDFSKIVSSQHAIYSTLTRDIGTLTSASLLIIEFQTSLVLILGCFVYMFILSPLLFFISLSVVLLGVLLYRKGIKRNTELFKNSRNYEQIFLKYFNSVLLGIKEINLEPLKGKQIFHDKIDPVINDSFRNNKKAYTGYLNNQVTGQVLFYLLVTFMVLYAGDVFSINKSTVVSFVFILLYVLGPLENIMIILPTLTMASIAANKLIQLKSDLETEQTGNSATVESGPPLVFRRIEVTNLTYQYTRDEASFKIGPLNFEVNKGEIIFIYGGNGSGKTTFLYTLVHLLKHEEGMFLVNESELNKTYSIAEYKKIFSPVFSNYFLFDELFGIEQVDTQRAKEYLDLFEINGKVIIEDGKFSTIDLSTGQRKRLALVTALLEKKDILVLDEWAADQDPAFRKKFYIKILPLLKKQGFTIIAITHDDKYYDVADELYCMDYGKLIKEEKHQEIASAY